MSESDLENLIGNADTREIIERTDSELFRRLARIEAHILKSGDSELMDDFKYIEKDEHEKTISKYTDSMTGSLNRDAIPVEIDRLVSKLSVEKDLIEHGYNASVRGFNNAGRRSVTRELKESDHRNNLSENIYVAMLDIDHFKQFNDTHGHDVGDEVLKSFSGTIRDNLRGGKLMRYGGEEFTIVLDSANIVDAHSALNRVRGIVEDTAHKGIAIKNGAELETPITVSIGFTKYDSNQDETWEVALKRADDALYDSKNNGRNQVSFLGRADYVK